MNLDDWLSELRRWSRRSIVSAATGARTSREILYRHLLHDAAHASQIDLPVMFPVESAANYSLLYVILRAYLELPISRVLEIGSGQTSLLLDSLSKSERRSLSVLTIEHDKHWSEQ